MIFKEFIGTTPKYKASLKDENGNVINPSSAFSKVIIKIYNIDSGNLIIGYTSESPIPGSINEYKNCILSSTEIKWAIPQEITLEAEPRENRVEVWTYKTDADIPDEGVNVELYTGTLNEFIDAQSDED